MFTETFAEAWEKRYGTAPTFSFPQLAPFLQHRSVRKFSSQPVEEDVMRALVACAQSASTSSSLQLWSIVSVQHPETREELATLCDNYQHIKDCGWFLCFIVDHYRLKQAAAQVSEEALGLPYAEFFTMAVVDAALASERMAAAAESIGLAICYIGALRNNTAEVKRILNLPEQTFGVYGLCIGWPEKPVHAEVKPRLPQETIWHRETYKHEVDVSEYDRQMSAFYQSQKMKGDVTWSMRSARRVDEDHMTGREGLLDWLKEQGFLER